MFCNLPVRLYLSLVLLALPTIASALPGDKAFAAENWAEAYDGYRQTILDTETSDQTVANRLKRAADCLARLNRVDEFDAFVASVDKAHPQKWRVQEAIAEEYGRTQHQGFMIAGEFKRGQHRGGGEAVSSFARDRVLALRHLVRAVELAKASDKPIHESELARVWRRVAYVLENRNWSNDAWRLQLLTNLDELPDYQKGWYNYGGGAKGAPVDAEGNPILHELPESWETAKSDGERWRWALQQMQVAKPYYWIEDIRIRGEWLHQQFGVQTLANMGPWFRGGWGEAPANDKDADAGIFALDTLSDDETIARLATGVKRFKLPAEHNPIRLWQAGIKRAKQEKNRYEVANCATRLAQVMENRRQYLRAAEYWQVVKENSTGYHAKNAAERIAQIEKPWGEFGTETTQPAGEGATVDFRFRNGKLVKLIAHKVDVEQLLDDAKEYLKSQPKKLSWDKLQIQSLGQRLIQKDRDRYAKQQVAQWEVELKPAENHFDKQTTLTTPLQQPGAYLVTAEMADGNTSQIVLWVADTAIVRKPLAGKMLYFVADARTGKPIAGAALELFGYQQKQNPNKPNDYQITTAAFAQKTDANGLATIEVRDRQNQRGELDAESSWLTIARTDQGRLAYLGFNGVWRATMQPQRYDQNKAVVITDRPVYRPGQKVQYKAWIARATYDSPADETPFAHQSFKVELYNAKNEKVETKTLTANAYGGIAGEYTPTADDPLGVYRIQIVGYQSGAFRLEEYKKPEFEVSIESPDKPLKLGDKFTATVKANYYFGSPVTSATVKYKVLRTERDGRWFPTMPWDWLYGPGYWWQGVDYEWYPGWQRWGCWGPTPFWFWQQTPPPEVVAEGESPLGADGTLPIEIDTALAKELHGDTDHSYSITAEVVDASRRTIVGSASVIAARQPLAATVWLDRGYYRVGNTVAVNVATRTAAGEPLAATGKLRLLQIKYSEDENGELQSEETEVRNWDLATDATGMARLQIKATEQGRYRVSYTVEGKPGEKVSKKPSEQVEAGYIFTITGEGFDGSDFEFNDLELVLDKQQYAPGDKPQLQINTNRRGSTVLLFVRPSHGVYPEPQVVKLTGKSTIVPLEVSTADMPNFFVEAITLSNAKEHQAVRQVIVPPASRVLNVEVLPSAEAYLPGQDATVKLRLTDAAGEPFVGETVISIYDKSVEYISGGSNVPDLREHFWKWRRDHRPSGQNSLSRSEGNLVPKGQERMQTLGVFGRVLDEIVLGKKLSMSDGGVGGGRNGILSRSSRMKKAMSMPAAAMADGMMEMEEAAQEAGSEPAMVEPTVRKEFADTALWVASLETGKDGLAEVSLKMPENLTAWKVRVWSMGGGARVGEGTAEMVTRKNLLVRLQTPRFLVETDEVVLSANVHNYLDKEKLVEVRLELEGETLEATKELKTSITIPAGEDRRVDWRVKALREGEATVRALALTDEESDAMQITFPVLVHGAVKMDSYSGVVGLDANSGAFEINVPSERRAEQTRLEVRYTPTLAGAMVDALPYLIEYPHGCTEQTLNRFLPAVITQQTLKRMGVPLKKPAGEGPKGDGIEKTNPVFDEAELAKIVRTGVRRLTDMQLADGGWGWFSGYGERSSAHTTAVVVRGLKIARDNEVAILPNVIDRGVAWLQRYQSQQLAHLKNVDNKGNVIDKNKPHKRQADNLDALVYDVLAEASKRDTEMESRLVKDRGNLAPYALAMLGHGLHLNDQIKSRDLVIRNLKQFVVTDAENQTAYLNLPGGYWWYWYGSEFEAHAYFLKLLAVTEPQSDLSAGLVKYLLNNRKHASYWNSTRDTALVVEAMADYLEASGEASPDMTIEVWLDGKKRKEVKVTRENVFDFDDSLVLTGSDLESGRHTVELRKVSGNGEPKGRVYYSAYLTNFTLEEDIRAAGLEVQVSRKLFKLTPVKATNQVAGSRGQAIAQAGEKFERTEITNLASVESSDLIEVELTIDSKNDYEYLLLTDAKAAGFEPVEVQSGYNGNAMRAYVEYRDQTVNLFVNRLARGTHSVSYRLRAETPGKFCALPTVIQAMYAPELRGNSNEIKVRVEDKLEDKPAADEASDNE